MQNCGRNRTGGQTETGVSDSSVAGNRPVKFALAN